MVELDVCCLVETTLIKNKDQCRTVQVKCANSSGNHRATAKSCSIYKTAYEIEQENAFMKQVMKEIVR